ncbi:MAG: hypothetical protein IT428_04590 [Planctomycetaceae bacterium]|nr:hypothetical protein [Planctomycetaceae bacterium]
MPVATPEEIRAGSDAVRSAFGFAEQIVELSRARVTTATQKDRVLRAIVAMFGQLSKAIENAQETFTGEAMKAITAEAAMPPLSAHTDAMAFAQKVATAIRTSAALMDWSIPTSTASPAAIKRMEKKKLLSVPRKTKINPADLHPKVFVKPVESPATWPFTADRSAEIFDNIERRLRLEVPSLSASLKREAAAALASTEAPQRQPAASPATTETDPVTLAIALLLDPTITSEVKLADAAGIHRSTLRGKKRYRDSRDKARPEWSRKKSTAKVRGTKDKSGNVEAWRDDEPE